MSNEAPTEAQDQVEQPAGLTVQDLQNIRNIIDVASQRGAFRANEFSSVGDTYTKLITFLESIQPPADAEAAQPEATEE